MANHDHLSLLQQGVTAWNLAQQKSPFDADLRNADLGDLQARGIRLIKANLEGANLQGADLSRADLSGADLRSANLEGANLRGADLQNAFVGGADLFGSDLSNAFFVGANVRTLTGREAKPTDFRNALGLTQAQLNSMRGDAETLIPADLSHPDNWAGSQDALEPQPLARSVEEPRSPKPLKKPSPIPFTPPSEFETVGEALSPQHIPERPEPRRPSRTPPDTARTEAVREGLAALGSTFASNLRRYERIEGDISNRVKAAEQILRTTEGLLKALRAEPDAFLPTLLEDYVETLAAAYAEDVFALEKADAVLYERFIKRGRELCAYYPELAEIGDPANTRFIPDDFPYTVETLTAEIDGIVASEEGFAHFSDATRDLIEGEKQATVPKEADPEKTRLARLAGIAGEMHREMERVEGGLEKGVKRTETWFKLYDRVVKLWDRIGPIIERVVDA